MPEHDGSFMKICNHFHFSWDEIQECKAGKAPWWRKAWWTIRTFLGIGV